MKRINYYGQLRLFLLGIVFVFAILSPLTPLCTYAQTPITMDKVNYIALSPQAAALHDAINYPVDGNKGAPDISIPLYTIKYGKISIPLTLRYTTSAAKTDKSTAPNVAFGWVLDVGGSINRTIRGKPDEASNWYQAYDTTYFDQLRTSNDQFTISSIYGWHGINEYDSEKDEFVMSTPNGRATFYITGSDGSYTGHFSPSVNWKINSTKRFSTAGTKPMFTSIDILDGDGTQYRFGSGSSSTSPTSPDAPYIEYCSYGIIGQETTYASGWQLREVEDDAGNKVSYKYTRSGNSTHSAMQDHWYLIQDSVDIYWTAGAPSAGQKANDYVNSYFPEGSNTYRPYSMVSFQQVNPSEITWPQGKITIEVSSTTHTISSIRIYDKSGNQIRKIVFSTTSNNIDADKPLLLSVTVIDAGNTPQQVYSMSYSTVSWTYNYPSCDWWGYFNGTIPQNSGYLPNRTFTAYGYDFTTSFSLGNGGHREPHASNILHNILKSITYPSGGSTEFTFEPNTYSKERGMTVTSGIGPGLRIKTVQHKDKDGTVLRKLGYTYTGGNISVIPNDARYTASITHQMSVFEDDLDLSVEFIVTDRTRLVTPRYVSQVGGGGEAVEYDSVTETVYNGTTVVGRTVSTYTLPDNFQLGTLGFLNASDARFSLEEYHPQGESLSYNMSRITKKEEYSGNGSLVRRTNYKYVFNENALLTNMGFYHLVYYHHPEAEYYNSDNRLMKDYWSIRRMFLLNVDDAIAPLYYYLYTSSRGYCYPAGETVETFPVSNDGSVSSSNPFTVDRTITYTTGYPYHYPSELRHIRSDNKNEIIEFDYPFTIVGNAMNDSLVARHIVSAVVGQAKKVGNTYIDAYAVDYNRYAGTNAPYGHFFRPITIKYSTGKSQATDTRISFAGYDTYGNPRSIIYNNNDTENYVWSYSHQTPVAKVTGATWSEVVSAMSTSTLIALDTASFPSDATVTSALTSLRGISVALTDGRTHRPHYGVSGEYDPSSRKLTYTYDAFQRLITGFDNASKVKMAIEYKDAAGAGNSYVKVSTPDTAMTTIGGVPATGRRTVAKYFDGQYREKQSVQAYGSGTGKDLVLPYNTYDAYGRVTDMWLPYGTTATGGSYHPDYLSEQLSFYSTLYDNTEAPYARYRKVYENSPVGRVLKEYLPGAGQYLNYPTKHDYGVNAANEIYRWNITASTSTVTRGSFYDAGALMKEIVTDPDGRVTTTYTDKNGNVVETRIGDLRTSYVFNDAGLLVAVIPPKAQPGGTTLTATMYYRYIYDSRNRLIENYIPDKGKTEFVYDANDRLVASRDVAEQSLGKWRFYRYDRVGREVYSGLVASTATAATLRTSYTNKVFNQSCSSSGAIAGYTSTDNVLPVALKDVLNVIYYDSYGYTGEKAFSAAGAEVGQTSPSVQSSAVKGLVTGHKSKVLDGNELTTSGILLTTSLYYNDLGDMIQEVGDLYTGGTAGTFRRSTLYRHQGEVAAIKESQTVGSVTTTVVRKYGYDYSGRQTSVKQSVNGGAYIPLETATFDAIGRQSTRNLGSNVQTVDYSWDIRDRLSSINNPSSLGSDKFGISYTYERGGNVSGLSWAHSGGSTQSYSYAYDNYGRLTSGTHSDGNSESAVYDLNGNFTSLTRAGVRAETLNYTYASGTNRIEYLKSNGVQKNYAHNNDGTMSTDGLRGLNIAYNSLKYPKIVSNSSSTITYIYDAVGNKLAVLQDGVKKNIYCGEFVYDANLGVDYIITPVGQMTNNSGTFTPQFNITDHLGNVRSVVNSSGAVLQSTDYYPFGLAFADNNVTTNRYLFNGKELENYTLGTTYLGTLDYGARHYDPRIARWTVPDPMSEKYYGISGYVYCAGNPVRLIDPDGRDPIYAKNFWGKVNLIGDDGKNSTGSYLVKNSVAREVKRATKAGKFYTGDLSENRKVMHIPTGQKLEGVKQSYEDTKISQKENGGHANIGDANVTRWDEGLAAISFTDKDGNQGAKASLQMFVVNGKNTMPTDASNVEMWWHTHPNTTVNGISLGNSTPSDADYSGQKTMTNRGYKGNTFVIGVRSGKVTFFNKDDILKTVKWTDFLRMGGQKE